MDTTSHVASGLRDFDFLYGDWKIHHHRLNRRLVGQTAWTDFEGTSRARPLLGGLGNIDENVLDLPSGRYEAATVRLYDAKQGLWSIWWIDARNPGIDSPMQGSFADGVGTFYADDVHEGIPIRVRFLWTEITAASARWAQAFSVDGGTTWETNWTMLLERVA
jgi:hypothetical protein